MGRRGVCVNLARGPSVASTVEALLAACPLLYCQKPGLLPVLREAYIDTIDETRANELKSELEDIAKLQDAQSALAGQRHFCVAELHPSALALLAKHLEKANFAVMRESSNVYDEQPKAALYFTQSRHGEEGSSEPELALMIAPEGRTGQVGYVLDSRGEVTEARHFAKWYEHDFGHMRYVSANSETPSDKIQRCMAAHLISYVLKNRSGSQQQEAEGLHVSETPGKVQLWVDPSTHAVYCKGSADSNQHPITTEASNIAVDEKGCGSITLRHRVYAVLNGEVQLHTA